MYLMCKDVPVLQFDTTKGEYKVLCEQLLPVRLRGAYQFTSQMHHDMSNNYDVTIDYLASRVLDLSRKNAKKILNAFHLSQDQSPNNKARIAIACRTVSLTDSYWIKLENESKIWQNSDPKHNHLHEIVAHIALSGSSLTLSGNPKELETPELTLHGAYAKAWFREKDGIYLHKESDYNQESLREISVSNILDCLNVPHVQYLPANEQNTICRCKNAATDQLDMVTAEDVYRFCNRNQLDFKKYCLKIDAETIHQMVIVDYLISNTDRHNRNWGFYMNNSTGNLIKCHPLYDHNNAFDQKLMENGNDRESDFFLGSSMKEAAGYAIKRCNFVSTKPITRDLFMSSTMYESFMERADQLGLYKEMKPTLAQRLHFVPYNQYEPTTICEYATKTYQQDLDAKYQQDINTNIEFVEYTLGHRPAIEQSNIEQMQEMDLGDHELLITEELEIEL